MFRVSLFYFLQPVPASGVGAGKGLVPVAKATMTSFLQPVPATGVGAGKGLVPAATTATSPDLGAGLLIKFQYSHMRYNITGLYNSPITEL